jgi:hypothetical protein
MPKNMGALTPAEKSRCWRQYLKVVAQRTQTLLQDKKQGRCSCAHPERVEAEEGRGNVAEEMQTHRWEVAMRLRVL